MMTKIGGLVPVEAQKAVAKSNLDKSAEALAVLTETLPGLLDILDLLAGAVYSLQMAESLGFRDRPGEFKPQYKENLVKRLKRMSKQNLPSSGLWLAGLHFNSGIQRLAACYRRSQGVFKRLHRRFQSSRGGDFATDDLERLRVEANKIKHDEYGLLSGRQVAFAVAVAGLGDLLSELRERSPELRQHYS
jgi:hypothetical protein